MVKLLSTLPSVRYIGLAVLILAYSMAASASPVVGPEASICRSFRPALGNQEAVAIAGASDGYLAVWQDSRGTNGTDIFGCRISSTGQVLDPFGIAISTSWANQSDPAVAWNGQMYLVVWADTRDSTQHIYGARVLPSGEVIEKQGILLSGSIGIQGYPRVASDGRNWLVVWQDARGTSSDIYGCTVSSDGPVGRVYGISTRADNEEAPDVAWNGSSYLVTWTDYRNADVTDTDIYGCRVARNGVRMGTDILVSCDGSGTSGVVGEQSNQRVCGFGTSCMVVWQDYRDGSGHSHIYGARVSSSGTVLDRNGIVVSNATGDQETPSIAYDGRKLLATWRSRPDRLVRGARLDTAGTLLDPNGISISQGMAGSSGLAISAANGSFIVGWSSLTFSDSDALTTLVSDGGAAQTPAGVVTSTAADSQWDYAVVDNGSDYAVVWSQLVNGQCDILAAKVSRSGALLTPNPVNVTSGYAGDQTQPSIAWNGSKYLVAWRGGETYSSTDYDIRGQFLDRDLRFIGTSATDICTVEMEQARPCVTSNGSNFLVTWEDYRNAVSPDYASDLYGAIISSSGAMTPVSPVIAYSAGNQSRPRSASDGSGYLVVWEDYTSGLPVAYGARISSTGAKLDTTAIRMPPATAQYQITPDVCFGGGNYFVTWTDGYSVLGCRVSTGGVILDKSGISIDTGSKPRACPTACWDGSKYVVTWEDYRSSLSGNSDLYCTTVGATGVPSSDPAVAMVSDMYPELMPRVFSYGAFGTIFYSRYYNYSHCLTVASLTEQGVQQIEKVMDAKSLPAGSQVAMSGKPITAAFPGYFYIEELDRSSGIKVVSGTSVTVGSLVDVTGVVGTFDGERQISASLVVSTGVSDKPLRQIAVRGDWLGGGWLNAFTPGITGAAGANNIGLLVTTWGKVLSKDSGYFYIESKPGTRIRVKTDLPAPAVVGSLVSVTGISTCEVIEGSTARAILPRQPSDIRFIK